MRESGQLPVSTHSRPKAAAREAGMEARVDHSFNTQPPEGGCFGAVCLNQLFAWFQHTAARRRLRYADTLALYAAVFQHTAARRRLLQTAFNAKLQEQFQHTAARRRLPTVSSIIA